MTFREIAIWADGVNERNKELWKDQVTLAWLNANLSRVPLAAKRGDKDPFPLLESLFPKPAIKSQDRAAAKQAIRDRVLNWQKSVNRRQRKTKKSKRNG